MSSIRINGRDIPVDEMTELYKDERGAYMLVIYGESETEIDPFTADLIIESRSQIVDEAIIEQRKAAALFQKSFVS